MTDSRTASGRISSGVSVLLPAWNEGENLPRLAEAILGYAGVSELIVVDDASSDDTFSLWQSASVSRDARVRFLRNPQRLGLACSILQALRLATKDLVLVRDSDWNHDVETFPALLAAVEAGANVAIASRYERGVRVGRWNDVLSIFLSRVLSFGGRGITDWTYGYFLIRRELLAESPVGWIFRGRGEYSVRLYRWLLKNFAGLKVASVPTEVQARGAGQSSTRPFRHGMAYLATFLESLPGQRESAADILDALKEWRRKGQGAAACGHSGPGLRSRLALLEKEMGSVRGPVLDLGCGNGAFTSLALAGNSALIDGIDLSPELLAEASSSYRQVAAGDLRQGLPSALAGQRYAGIFCFEVIQYLSWAELCCLFREAKKHSGPGAYFLCLFPHRAGFWHRVRHSLGLGREDYLSSHDSSLLVAAAQEAGWRWSRGWSCSYGSAEPRAVESPQKPALSQAHFLFVFHT